jgi:hypothetical protein
MSFFRTATCAAILLAGAATANSALAGNKANLGASASSPGQQMRASGGPTAGDHGASSWSPGQQMQGANTSSTPPGQFAEPGASGFAPGDAISKGKK